jgi:hypothetical protein
VRSVQALVSALRDWISSITQITWPQEQNIARAEILEVWV